MKNKRKSVQYGIVALSAVLILQIGYITYSMVGVNNKGKDADKQTTIQKVDDAVGTTALSDDADAKTVDKPEKDIDTSKVDISKDLQDYIAQNDPDNEKGNLAMYKKMAAEFEIPLKYEDAISQMLKKKYKLNEIMTAFDYLYQNYGLISELEPLLADYKNLNSWTQVFEKYNAAHKEFVPKDFSLELLQKLTKAGMSSDDIIIADRLSQKSLSTFEELITMRENGKTWRDINIGLGVVNVSGKLLRVTVTNSQIKKYMDATGLSRSRVMEAFVLAEKMDMNIDDIIDKFSNNEKKEKIYDECYSEKYK
jgi:hypothetical protein